MFQGLSFGQHAITVEQLRALALSSAVNFIAAVIILLIGWALARLFGRWTGRLLERTSHIDPTLRPILVSLVRYSILIVTIIAVLNRFGVQTTSLIAVIGAAGLAIGLAIQGALSNVAAGAMLLMLRPFRVGDYIEAGGHGGTVREIGLFTTLLTSADLVFISMPNSQIFSGTIINYSREPTRRINFTVGIDYEDDIDAAQKIVMEVMQADTRILKEPKPMAPVGALGASSVDIIVRCWVPNALYWDILFDLQKKVKLALEAGGVTIPFPQHVVTMRGGNQPAAEAK